jgi:hypothetical protein
MMPGWKDKKVILPVLKEITRSARHSPTGDKSPAVPEKIRQGDLKNPCNSAEPEENHERGPRGSWAGNQMGNVNCYALRPLV